MILLWIEISLDH